MRVTVEVELVLQDTSKRTFEVDGNKVEKCLRSIVLKELQLNEGRDLVFERYDSSFEEWVDLEEDEELEPIVKLRITEKQNDSTTATELVKVMGSIAAAEEKLHNLVTFMNRTPTLLSTEITSQGRVDNDSFDILSNRSFNDEHHTLTPREHEEHDDVHVITAKEAYEHYYAGIGKDSFFVDVRGKEEAHETGMIEGAIRAHKGLLEWHVDKDSSLFIPMLLSGKELVLYASGNVTEGGRPGAAARTLVQMGVPNVHVMKEGLHSWKAHGFPVACEEAVYGDVKPTVKLRCTVHDMVLEATKSTNFISVHASYELLDVQDIVFVDVRSLEEVHETGVIKGAAVANRELIEWYTDPQSQSHHKLFNPLFGSGKKLILYGGGLVGGGRPILVSVTLRKVLPYHANVCVLEGGFQAWVAAGHPTEPVDVLATPEPPPVHVSEVSAVASFFPRRSPSFDVAEDVPHV
eukprot:TRINITY_DN34437_c0_g1_i1.p1 TRINITY_DN34437_c0_g1~~TRINITY_DN34437_c0_g1_i1.p1  ORF type:complete len:463 (+),score=88.60 TRINITY_DN34437_c0_g1_i1:43-1431(+)